MSKRLLSEIMRGAWMVEPQTAIAHLPDVANFLNGEQLAVIDRENDNEASHFFIDAEGGQYRKSLDSEDIQPGSIMVVNLTGTMIKYGTMCSWGADELTSKLQAAENNTNVIGSILRTDSGGGSVAAIGLFVDFLTSERTKPVVALCDMAASAAYYTAVHCDHIMAENNISSEFGSIGVMCQFADFSEYYEKEGIKIHTIYSDHSANKNEEFQKALKGDYTLIKQESLNPLAVKFQNAVKEARPNLKLEEPGLLNGKMFYAERALDLGMIDSIGNINAAINKVKELAGNTGNIINNKNDEPMTYEELQASHPALFNQVHAEGKKAGKSEEQIRVKSWLAHHDSDPKRVIEGIKKDEELTADVREEMIVTAQMNKRAGKDENADDLDTSAEAKKAEEEMKAALEEDVKSINDSL